MTQRDELLDS